MVKIKIKEVSFCVPKGLFPEENRPVLALEKDETFEGEIIKGHWLSGSVSCGIFSGGWSEGGISWTKAEFKKYCKKWFYIEELINALM